MLVCPSVCSVTRPAVGSVVSINTLRHRPSSLYRPMRRCSVAWKFRQISKIRDDPAGAGLSSNLSSWHHPVCVDSGTRWAVLRKVC